MKNCMRWSLLVLEMHQSGVCGAASTDRKRRRGVFGVGALFGFCSIVVVVVVISTRLIFEVEPIIAVFGA